MESSFTGSSRHSKRQSSSTFANTVGDKINWLKNRVSTTPHQPARSSRLRTVHDIHHGVAEDPLLDIDIDAHLLPNGPMDPLDPASYHALLAHANTLISTLHSGYQSRCRALSDARREVAAQTDELDEAETRARHLKMQLGNLTSRMGDTETSLREQLLEERRRREELETRLKEMERREITRGVDEKWTAKGASRDSVASDSGFESDRESEASASSTSTASTYSVQSEHMDELAIERDPTTYGPVRPHAQVKQGSDRLRQFSPEYQGGADLRTENMMLKERVAELEGAVDACLALL